MKRILAILLLCLPASASAQEVAYLRAPRNPAGGIFKTASVSEANGPYVYYKETDLMLRRDDGSVVTLVENNIADFKRSRDGKSIYFTQVTAPQPSGFYQANTGRADIWKLDLASRVKTQITNGPGWNCQAVELPGGDIAFLSNRDQWQNPHEGYCALTIYRMSSDGQRQRRIWHAGLGGAFGLDMAPSGRLVFSSGENQGTRGGGGQNWSALTVNADGGDFMPEFSAFHNHLGPHNPFDFLAYTSDGTLVLSYYYDTRIYGMGLAIPPFRPDGFELRKRFGDPLFTKNPAVVSGDIPERFGWQPDGLYSFATCFNSADRENVNAAGEKPGMISHPIPTQGNGVLVTWTGDAGDAQMDLDVMKVADVKQPISHHAQLIPVVNDPNFHEWMGTELISDVELWGHEVPETKSPQAEWLPPGSPYFAFGTSDVSFYNEWQQLSEGGWNSELVKPESDEPEYVRIVYFEPTLRRAVASLKELWIQHQTSRNGEGLWSAVNEMLGYYETLVPLKKWRCTDGSLYLGPDPPPGAARILRADGKPDSSFLCELPANTPFAPSLVDKNKRLIHRSYAETWHQGIPGELKYNCQGCHAHHRPDPIPFERTLAAMAEYLQQIKRLNKVRTVTFEKDIAPLGLAIDRKPWLASATVTAKSKPFASAVESLKELGRTPEEVTLIADWQDAGFPAEGLLAGGSPFPAGNKFGPNADKMPPPVNIVALSDRYVVGAMDPRSGLDLSSLHIWHNDVEITSSFTFDAAQDTWTFRTEPKAGVLRVAVKDNHGNLTDESELVSLDNLPPPPDDPPPPPPEAVKAVDYAFSSTGLASSATPTPTG